MQTYAGFGPAEDRGSFLQVAKADALAMAAEIFLHRPGRVPNSRGEVAGVAAMQAAPSLHLWPPVHRKGLQ